ncbi:MAG: HAD family hydrolase [Anaerolineales bacterium]|nr:HAD family hydrolase [Anaerolineales bacterium]
MSKYQHVLWDFNGTLLQDAGLCIDVMNDMLNRRGLKTLSPQRYAEIFDFPVQAYYQRAGWDLSRYPFEQLSDEFMSGYHAGKLACNLRPEAVEVFSKLYARGVKQYIISAAQLSMVEELVAHFQIKQYFTSLHGLDNHHAAGKMEIALGWMEQTGADPEEVIFIGDTTHDKEVADAIGVGCVLVYSGHQTLAKLQATGAPVVESLEEIRFF